MKKVTLIGNAHLDPAWLWPWTDGYAEVRATFRSALDRIKEFPDFIFTCSSAAYYKWIEESDPEMFEEIRQRVKEGRIVPVNGWWVQPDCNIPCGESFARQSLYSQNYYFEKFGITCKTGYNVDSFGHSGMLPQILKLSGMDSYVFMRPGNHENPKVPGLFLWESKDGSQVKTFKIPDGYGSDNRGIRGKIDRSKATVDEHGTMMFYGVGNHGGGPTIFMLKTLEEEMKKEDNLLFYGSPDSYFAELDADDLPIFRDDLQIHAIGCYTAFLPVKQQNRLAETSVLHAEYWNTVAGQLAGEKPQTARLKDAWERILFNQFHDILCGCSVRDVYQSALASFGYASTIGTEVMNSAVQRISRNIDTLGEDDLPTSKDEDWMLWGLGKKGTPLVVFNSCAHDAVLPVQARGNFACITDSNGNEMEIQRVRCQVTNGDSDKWNTLFCAPIPAMGWKTFWLHKNTDSAYTPETDLSGRSDLLANRKLSVRFDEEGNLNSIFLKDQKIELLSGSASFLVIDETNSDTWGHNLFEYRNVIGKFKVTSSEMIENGPVRVSIRQNLEFNRSNILATWRVYKASEKIELNLLVDWHEHHRMLKLELPVRTGENGVAEAEIPYGSIIREQNGKEKPLQRWIDIKGDNGGVCLVNDSNYAADVLDRTVRMTLLRSPIFADHYGVRDDQCEFTDQGEHRINFVLLPHDSSSFTEADAVKAANELNKTPYLVYETYHHGALALESRTLQCSADNVCVTAFKYAEDGNGYILRCYETNGIRTEATLHITALNYDLTFQIDPYQIVTFRILPGKEIKAEKVLLTEFPLN